MTTIPLTQINETNRARKDYGDLDGLAESLKNLGSIHPIVLSRNPQGTYDIIAGGRRFRATKNLGLTELTHGSVLEPGHVGFLFREEVPLETLKEAELDENLWRLKPSWQEDVMLIADVHELKREKEGRKWGQRQTAEILGKGFGLTKVSHAVRLAALLKKDDDEIKKCETMSDAVSVLIRRQEEKALAEGQKRVATVTPRVDLGSFLETLTGDPTTAKKPFIPSIEKIQEAVATGVPIPSTAAPGVAAAAVRIPLSSMFQCGDFREVLKSVPDAAFHHVVTDIPYGIDMKNLDTTKSVDQVAAEHNVEENVELMEPFLTEAFRVTRSGGFCVFCYDLDWHEYLQSTAENIGWRVQRWPLIIYKTSACQNNAAQYNFTKNFECAMVLRRDEQSVLRSQQATSVWMGEFATERRLYNNPFAKPFALWKWIYNAIAFPGQNVLDPFCGEMSACRAAVNCGLQPFGVELKESHFNRGLEHMRAVYSVIHSNVEFV